jgi:hypothetical protein
MRMNSMARSRGVQVRDLKPKPCGAVCECVCARLRVKSTYMSKAVGARAVGETWYREVVKTWYRVVLKTWYREVHIPTQCIHMLTDWSRARAQTSTISQMLTSEILPSDSLRVLSWLPSRARIIHLLQFGDEPVSVGGPHTQTHPFRIPRAGDLREQGSRPLPRAKTCDGLPLAGSNRPSFLSEEVVPS